MEEADSIQFMREDLRLSASLILMSSRFIKSIKVLYQLKPERPLELLSIKVIQVAASNHKPHAVNYFDFCVSKSEIIETLYVSSVTSCLLCLRLRIRCIMRDYQ